MDLIHDSLQNFIAFQKNYEEYKKIDLSESDTRSKVIDKLFVEILGWTELDFQREGFGENGYYDYRFYTSRFNFLVEAKKIFSDFQLPNNHRYTFINVLLKGNKDVIEQMRKYLFDQSLQYGIITNGHQFIIGKFVNNDGSEWKKNKCIIFNGFHDIESNFIFFYNLLSKKSIIENSGINIQDGEIIKGNTILSTLSKRDGELLIRNTLSSNLVSVLDIVFGELYKYETLNNKELFEECFIENLDTKKNKTDIEKLFDDNPPELHEVIPAKNTFRLSKQIEKELSQIENNIASPPPKPIIIVGSKGAGKTTFIKYLFNFAISEYILEDKPNIYVDFRNYINFDIKKDIPKLYRDILENIYEKYIHLDLNSETALKRMYSKELKRNDDLIWKSNKENNTSIYNEKVREYLSRQREDHEIHLEKLSEYLIRDRRMRLTIIIDNADQLDFDIQKEIFLFAQSLNFKYKCAVIISIREGYYYRLRNHTPFDAFTNNVYHVSAPPYKEVLQKRMNYTVKKINLKGKIAGIWGETKTLEIDSQTVIDFFSNLDKSLFIADNSEMLRYLEQTTYPNLRQGLESFKDFLLSGHTKVSDYVLRKYLEPEAKIPIPLQEFIKSIALENKMYYNHENSKIHNLFFPSEGSTLHFVKLKLLKYLFEKTKGHGYSERFILINELLNEFSDLGFHDKLIMNELNVLQEYKLIETDDQLTDVEKFKIDNTSHNISISLKGYYYLNELKNKFVYLDLILQDTPVFNIDYFNKLKGEFPLSNEKGYRDLKRRVDTTLIFFEYLKEQEEKEKNPQIPYLNSFCVEVFNSGLKIDLERIKNILKARNAIK